jgi:hypothetical protein
VPYDEGLAQRIRELLEEQPGLGEKKMFGGVAFLVRVGPEAHAASLGEPHVRPMDFTKRPMQGFVFVAPPGFEDDADLARWVSRGVGFAASLPGK